jgi:beta-glucosidase
LDNNGTRWTTSSEVDERTQMEMYFPPFEGALKAGVLSVMCANNLVNGVYVCENNRTGNWLLREHGGFQGWMCSDYDGTRSTIDAANHGLDVAMPGPPSRPDYFGAPLKAAVTRGDVSEATITEKAVRVVYSLAKVGALDTVNSNTSDTDVTSDAHRALARRLAAASATLLQNTGVLPLNLAALSAGAAGGVALIGLAARDAPVFGGGGSGAVVPKDPLSIYDALLARLGGGAPPQPGGHNCTVLGKDKDYFAGAKVSKRVALRKGSSVQSCCTACNRDDPQKWSFFTFNESQVGEADAGCWCHPKIGTVKTRAGMLSGFCGGSAAPTPAPAAGVLAYESGENVAAAVAAAKAAQVAVVVLAQSSHEGADRTTLALGQSELAAAVAAVQPKTVVVTVTPGPFLTPWRGAVAAILDLGMAGEQEGPAAADVLFGDVNPAGRLPHTLPTIENEMRMTAAQYPGEPPTGTTKAKPACSKVPTAPAADGRNPAGGTGAAPCVPWRAQYSEQLLVGYRWYDAHGVTPAFPFGHGLSYTTFAYSGLIASAAGASVTVTNSGRVAGQEVVQLYLGFPEAAGEPPQQLKAFGKTIALAPGESATVTLALTEREFSFWDVDTHAWVVAKGTHKVGVGASSRDIRLTSTIVM